jgi:hypothetical protein
MSVSQEDQFKLSTCLVGQSVGVKEADDGICLVSFIDYDLGYVDLCWAQQSGLGPMRRSVNNELPAPVFS